MKKYSSSIKISLIVIALVFSSFTSMSQSTSSFMPYWYLKASLGASAGYTDFQKGDLNFSADLGFGRQLSPVIGLEIKSYFGKLSGTQAVTAANLYESNLYDFSLNAVFNLSNLISGVQERDLSFYASLGIGQTQYNSFRVLDGVISYYGFSISPAALQGSGFGKRRVVATIPFGLGADYRINDQLSANFNFRMNWVDSDILDGYASGANKDLYSYTSLGLTYKLGKRKAKTVYFPEEEKPLIIPPPIIKEEPKKEVKVEETPPPPPPKEKVVEKPKVEVVKQVEKKLPEKEFRIQIRACYKVECSLEMISKKYNIEIKDIKMEFYHNYYIYTVGSFKTYKEAAMKKEILKTKNKILDAFVVNYINGKRIRP